MPRGAQLAQALVVTALARAFVVTAIRIPDHVSVFSLVQLICYTDFVPHDPVNFASLMLTTLLRC